MVASLAEAKSHPVTPEDFLNYDRAIRIAKREKEDASAQFSRAKKAAKNGAVDLQAYKFIEQMRRLEEEEQLVVCRHIVQYLNILEMPIGTQFSLIDAPKVPPVKPKAKAEYNLFLAGEAGLRAGRDGDGAESNPFEPGTEQHVAWLRKHSEGLTERVTAARMDVQDTPPVADAAKATARPSTGRKSRSQNANGEMAFNGGSKLHASKTTLN
jgi:hypothetical protein